MLEGTTKKTRLTEPITAPTAVAVVVAPGGPATAGFSVTLTFAGGIVPLGKFEPTTSIFVTPGSPEFGDVVDARVTTTGF